MYLIQRYLIRFPEIASMRRKASRGADFGRLLNRPAPAAEAAKDRRRDDRGLGKRSAWAEGVHQTLDARFQLVSQTRGGVAGSLPPGWR